MICSRPLEGRQQVTVPVARQRFEKEINAFRFLLEKRTTHQYIRHARQLYDWLIRPVESVLNQASIKTLVNVPQGVMSGIPIAALHDGKQFMVQRFALATTPGLALTDPGSLDRDATEVLVAGLSYPVQGFPALGGDEGDFGEEFPGYTWQREVVTPDLPIPVTSVEVREVHISVSWPDRGGTDSTSLVMYGIRPL